MHKRPSSQTNTYAYPIDTTKKAIVSKCLQSAQSSTPSSRQKSLCNAAAANPHTQLHSLTLLPCLGAAAFKQMQMPIPCTQQRKAFGSTCMQSAHSSTPSSRLKSLCNAAAVNPHTQLHNPTLPAYANALALKQIHTPNLSTQRKRPSFLNAYSLRKAACHPHARKAFATPTPLTRTHNSTSPH